MLSHIIYVTLKFVKRGSVVFPKRVSIELLRRRDGDFGVPMELFAAFLANDVSLQSVTVAKSSPIVVGVAIRAMDMRRQVVIHDDSLLFPV
jgi:hypothetical protein